jgi:hypothetical protein
LREQPTSFNRISSAFIAATDVPSQHDRYQDGCLLGRCPCGLVEFNDVLEMVAVFITGAVISHCPDDAVDE